MNAKVFCIGVSCIYPCYMERLFPGHWREKGFLGMLGIILSQVEKMLKVFLFNSSTVTLRNRIGLTEVKMGLLGGACSHYSRDKGAMHLLGAPRRKRKSEQLHLPLTGPRNTCTQCADDSRAPTSRLLYSPYDTSPRVHIKMQGTETSQITLNFL